MGAAGPSRDPYRLHHHQAKKRHADADADIVDTYHSDTDPNPDSADDADTDPNSADDAVTDTAGAGT